MGERQRLLVVQHEDGCTLGLMEAWLIDAGAELDVRRPYTADDPGLPADPSGHDGIVVLGGAMGADDDADNPWLPATKDLIRAAAASGTPVLGLCLGHQLCAVALGGTVAVNAAGQQFGVLPVGWLPAAADDPLCGPLTDLCIGVHWNNDVVVTPPADAVVLARAPRGEVQAARFAPTVWGLQWHPEVDDRLVAPWAEEDRDHYAPGEVDAVLRAIAERRDELLGWRALADSFLRLTARS